MDIGERVSHLKYLALINIIKHLWEEVMAVCYFDSNYDTKYKCTYEIKENIIEVEVEYDVSDEIETVDGVKIFGSNTEYRKRDILIVDYKNKKNILLKCAYYAGHNSVYGTPDGGDITKFQSYVFFEHAELEKISLLPETPKVSKIKIYSKAISDLIGYPSLTLKRSDSEYAVILSREDCSQSVDINTNNVKKITVADDWNSSRSSKLHNMTIDFSGYIEIELARRVNYDVVSDFINELKIFMQLYYPNKFSVDRICVKVGDIYYQLVLPQLDLEYKEKYVGKTVDEQLLDFLEKCYVTIPYRNSKTEIRNIPYIVMKTSRSIEDNFLMFYRFIECYYKKQQISNIRKTFVTHSIKEHYTIKHNLTDEEVEKYAQEIICLRNHYVHSGYYIKNSCLRISFDKINRKKNPKDYTVNNADVRWIYERTRILYKIAIDIIFNNILGYQEYKFDKHF